MSKTTGIPKRLARWVGVCVVLTTGIFSLAGRWLDPWLWAYVAVLWGAGLYATLCLDDDLARERFRPPDKGADGSALKLIRFIALAHLIVGALDVGRWHLTEVAAPVRLVGLVGMIPGLWLFFHAMMVNRFFSPVVRVQRDRGHQVIDRGPYAVVRHPGYVGMITAIPFGALVLGSWMGFAIALAYSLMMLRRVIIEDAFLRANLEGYLSYTTRVRYRLVPGLW
jgi:protein-S-isoprenylcysteine O-methyltransferase Ste14